MSYQEDLDSGPSTLIQAIQVEDQKVCETLIEEGAEKINQVNTEGKTPLLTAIGVQNLKLAQLLISNGADVNQFSQKKKQTPLSLALQLKQAQMLQLLINSGADVNSELTPMSPLAMACDLDNVSCCQLLIKNNAKVNPTTNTLPPLHYAIRKGSNVICRLLIENKADVNYCYQNQPDFENGMSILSYAVSLGNINVCRTLVSKGADVNHSYGGGKTVFGDAIKSGNVSLLELLINQGINLNYSKPPSQPGYVVQALNCKQFEICKFLLEQGANPKMTVPNQSALHLAAYHGQLDIVQMLIERLVDVNGTINGVSPLFIAAQQGHVDVVNFLIQNGADPNFCSQNGSSVFLEAAKTNKLEVCQYLQKQGVDVNKKNSSNCNALYYSAALGNRDMCEFLITKCGCDVNERFDKGASCLFIAVLHNHFKTAELLIHQDAEVNYVSKQLENHSVLSLACERGQYDLCCDLIDHGANVNHVQKDGLSPLYFAVNNGHLKICQLLIEQGADMYYKSDNFSSLIYLCVTQNKMDILNLFLECKYDINKKLGNKGYTVLHELVMQRDLKYINVLLGNGLDINAVTADNLSALQIAVLREDLEITQQLLARGANVNYHNKYGQTALHVASANKNLEMCKLLLSKGGDLLAKNSQGEPVWSTSILLDSAELLALFITIGKLNLKDLTIKGDSPSQFAYKHGKSNVIQILMSQEKSSKKDITQRSTETGYQHEKDSFRYEQNAAEYKKNMGYNSFMVPSFKDENNNETTKLNQDFLSQLSMNDFDPPSFKQQQEIFNQDKEQINSLKNKVKETPDVFKTDLPQFNTQQLKDQLGEDQPSHRQQSSHAQGMFTKSDLEQQLKASQGIPEITQQPNRQQQQQPDVKRVSSREKYKKGPMEVIEAMHPSLVQQQQYEVKQQPAKKPTPRPQKLDYDLFKAVEKRDYHLCERFLNKGANANCVDDDGWSVLQMAVKEDLLDIVKLLVKHGADVRFKNSAGMSILDEEFKFEVKNYKIITYLKETCPPAPVKEDIFSYNEEITPGIPNTKVTQKADQTQTYKPTNSFIQNLVKKKPQTQPQIEPGQDPYEIASFLQDPRKNPPTSQTDRYKKSQPAKNQKQTPEFFFQEGQNQQSAPMSSFFEQPVQNSSGLGQNSQKQKQQQPQQQYKHESSSTSHTYQPQDKFFFNESYQQPQHQLSSKPSYEGNILTHSEPNLQYPDLNSFGSQSSSYQNFNNFFTNHSQPVQNIPGQKFQGQQTKYPPENFSQQQKYPQQTYPLGNTSSPQPTNFQVKQNNKYKQNQLASMLQDTNQYPSQSKIKQQINQVEQIFPNQAVDNKNSYNNQLNQSNKDYEQDLASKLSFL